MNLLKIFSKKKDVNNNIFITGSNSGIGLELVKIFLEKNFKVVTIFNKKSHNLKNIKNKNLFFFKCNLENVKNIKKIKTFYTVNKSLYPNIIINNAGFFGGNKQTLQDLDFNYFIKAFKINCIAITKIIACLTQDFKPKQLRTILNISSIISSLTSNYANGNFIIYKSTKTALNSITRTISSDLKKKYKINTFLIHPGNVRTKMNPHGIENPSDVAKRIYRILISDCSKLNGRFINLRKKNIDW
jgi:short-subunit dehydrogenase